ncbi:MAG TPA: molybdate ABC transporter permease subunit, partial [Mycobacterium sp.]|nr:molybdate ABC transporter permease subunit [Mycobacterium sp.]
MTVGLDPEATRPELTDGEGGAPGLFDRRYGTTSLRVGAASIWLSVIVLLPLAAILWQAAGGGWSAFWSTVTSKAAVESFRVTLTVSIGVSLINLVFGLLVAWVLTRDD